MAKRLHFTIWLFSSGLGSQNETPTLLDVINTCGSTGTLTAGAIYACLIPKADTGLENHDQEIDLQDKRSVKISMCVFGFLYQIFQTIPCGCSICKYTESYCPGC